MNILDFKKIKNPFFFTCILFLSITLHGQNNQQLEHLKNQLSKTKNGKKRIDLTIEIEELNYNLDPKSWKKIAQEAKQIDYDAGVAKCLNNVGYSLSLEGNKTDAITFYQSSLDIYRKNGDKSGIAGAYNDIGAIYNDIDEKAKSLDYYKKAYDLYKEVKDSMGIALTSHNISSIYSDYHDYLKAKKFAMISYSILVKIGDKGGLPNILENLGGILENENKIDSALILYKQAYDISQSMHASHGVAFTGISIGSVYNTLYIQSGDKKFLDSAMHYLNQSFSLGKKLKSPEIQKKTSTRLMKAYAAIHDWEHAYEYNLLYHNLKDTLENVERQKEILTRNLNYEHNIELLKTSEQSKRQYYIIVSACIVVVILVVFSILIVRKWKQTNRHRIVIEDQKAIVEEKQKEILASINYAKRIQNAILPPSRMIKEFLPTSFILYLPKDIVAGDFYWMEHKDDKVLFAVADCTGHGVPGAMVSVVCNNGLNRSVREHGITDPGEILDKTREIVIQEFEKSDEDVKDGMDISICALSTLNKTLQWAGANNPLWIIRNNEVIVFKPDKQAIGKVENPKSFTTHSIELHPNDSIYIFSDGYQDQFGGDQNKKFKIAQMKELLLSIQEKTMEQQKMLINQAFTNWKGNEEQVDDVCILGFRL